MNSVVYLDEIDKIGNLEGEKAIQINGVLTHLLDPEQNSEFYDHYIGGEIPLDLSKVLFICSFNNEYNVDPIVLNRLKVIEIIFIIFY
jgi:ATP-dependent Lon protease